MKSVDLTCSACSKTFKHVVNPKGGGRPQRCLACRDSKNRARDLKNLEKKLGKDGAKEAAKAQGLTLSATDQAAQMALEATYPELLAVGLGIDPDPKRAAALVGLELPARQLKKVVEQAQKLKPLIEGQTAAVGDVLARSCAVMSLRLRALAPRLPPQQLPSAIKALGQAQELITGGARGSYVAITLVTPPIGPDGGTPK